MKCQELLINLDLQDIQSDFLKQEVTLKVEDRFDLLCGLSFLLHFCRLVRLLNCDAGGRRDGACKQL